MTDGSSRIGLLFVHGIGEQKRFEHMRASAAEIAELMLQADPGASMVTIDRTADWKLPAGVVDPSGAVPLTLELRSSDRRITFECREVWWADLGCRSGLGDTVQFWLWALGQWGAPIYRILDASHLTKDRPGFDVPLPSLTRLPCSVAGRGMEPIARAKLAIAALAALLVAFSWVLVKRVFSKLFGMAPSPTLIVQYVGDVHTYEGRAEPGGTNLSDPGFPRRVAIRRRMVTEMVAMATAGLDGWFVVAHSLGTVLAYNGLTEIGHTLPNYLPEAQWDALDALKHPGPRGEPGVDLKADPQCATRPLDEICEMMPARPPWIEGLEVLNRPLLFSKLRGILTYGSPLNKFAALWPRIVATATDRKDGVSAFPPDCEWVNYVAPQDPVAGWLSFFPPARFDGLIPRVANKRTPLGWHFGLAHNEYFSGMERFKRDFVSRQKREVVEWILGTRRASGISSWSDGHDAPVPVRIGVAGGYLVVMAVLWLGASVLITLVGGLGKALLGASAKVGFDSFCSFVKAVGGVAPLTVGYALTLVLLMGLLRWHRECALNLKLARNDAVADLKKSNDPERKAYWARLQDLLGRQKQVSGFFLFTAIPAVTWGLAGYYGFAPLLYRISMHDFNAFVAAAVGIAVSAVVQAIINGGIPQAREIGKIAVRKAS